MSLSSEFQFTEIGEFPSDWEIVKLENEEFFVILKSGIDKLSKDELKICIFEVKDALFFQPHHAPGYTQLLNLLRKLEAMKKAKTVFFKSVIMALF